MISIDDYLSFVDEALDTMVGIVSDLGDERANLRPDMAGANTPYVILTHCLGVMEYWAGHVVAGREITRDRDAEFRASGSVDDLLARARDARDRLGQDVAGCEPQAAPRGQVRPDDALLPLGRTQGGALMHIYEELSQHLGQMEVTRDVIEADWAVLSPRG
ncbi:MAG: DUF664 domain-containing protein [Acidimicrobiales bacterium]